MLVVGITGAARADSFSATTLTISPDPIHIGDTVTLTATVTTTQGDVTEGQGVNFTDNGDQIAPGTGYVAVTGSPDSGSAVLATSFATVGTHTVFAVFNGNGINSFASEDVIVLAAASTTTVSVTPNPSNAGEPITLVATVTASGGDIRGGLGVTFFDGPELLTTAPVGGDALNGTATFTTTFATTGTHDITAAFNGTDTVNASSSVATASIGLPLASLRLRAIQILATRMEALNSGQAFSGALDSAIDDGFDDSGPPLTVTPDGHVHLDFAPEGNGPDVPWPGGAVRPPRDWNMWADLHGTSVGGWLNGDSAPSTLSGLQLNALVGLGHKVTPNLLVGVVGGYEAAAFRSDQLDSNLDANGFTVGTYAGVEMGNTLRAFAAAGYTRLGYDSSAGDANGSFGANRLLLAGRVTGDIDMQMLTLEPSLNLFGILEHQDEYTDTLGTVQGARDFEEARISTGVKLLHPFDIDGAEMAPYAGLYADYDTSGDITGLDDLGLGGTSVSTALAGGLSARVNAGVVSHFDNGAKINVGAELGGLGATEQFWTLNAGFKQAF